MKKLFPILAVLFLSIFAAACGKTEDVPQDISHRLECVVTADELSQLDLTGIEELDLSGSTCYDEIELFISEHPGIDVKYTITLNGEEFAPKTEIVSLNSDCISENIDVLNHFHNLRTVEIDGTVSDIGILHRIRNIRDDINIVFNAEFSGLSISSTTEEISVSADRGECEKLICVIPYCSRLKLINIDSESGSGDFQLEDYAELRAAAGNECEIHYFFTLYGKTFDVNDNEIILKDIPVRDNADALLECLPYLDRCSYLDMDSCGLPNSRMEEIRDQFPNIKVVWRVKFSIYSARTDDTKILASIKGYNMTYYNVECLKYCTDVVYLDLGHNIIENISFVEYMPNLQVAILAINYWTDASPLSSCKNLEYLEIFNTGVSDLSPLSGLTNLKHLNICFLYKVTDISPLYNLTNLERLWVGCLTPVPDEQIAEFKMRVPDCVVNDSTVDPTDEGWRVGERYELLVQQFGYDDPSTAYSFHYS